MKMVDKLNEEIYQEIQQFRTSNNDIHKLLDIIVKLLELTGYLKSELEGRDNKLTGDDNEK